MSPEATDQLHGSDPRRVSTDPKEIAARFMPSLDHPSRIAHYKILELIGEGAMGYVYLAEQDEPVHQRVALKVMKLGMDTKHFIARFEAERQALALMNHPNLARFYAAGATDEGRPYFAMEYVPGIPITQFCDKNRMTTEERLRLFVDVCHAVQHAHQKGVIHRDIKPSNVLVGLQDGNPMAKVIDFGVAKAIQQRLTERTLFTEHGQLIGTPGYMSPEQAEMSPLDIDTRSDVYSLGALLYELLVGAKPFDDKMLRAAGFGEIQRIIREVDPQKPSTRLSSLGERSSTVATQRRTEIRALMRELRNDLDWVVMMCLEKERSRRYDTANALADDVQRFLRHEPVIAGPPTRAYRLRKFVRRNRSAVAAVAAVFVVLVGGLIVSMGLYRRSERERMRADAEAAVAHQINTFLVNLFRSSDPTEAQGHTITVREALDRGRSSVSDELANQPMVQASLMQTMGEVYFNLGLFPDARRLLEDSLGVRRRAMPSDLAGEADGLYRYAMVLDRQGDYIQAERHFRQALDLRRKCSTAPNAAIADCLAEIGLTLKERGNLGESRRLLHEALDMRRAVFGNEHRDVANSLVELGRLECQTGDLAKGGPFLREALEMRRKILPSTHPDLAESIFLLAALHDNQGRSKEAEARYQEALDLYRNIYPPEHHLIGDCLNQFGLFLFTQGRTDEAESMLREALAMHQKHLGENTVIAKELSTLGLISCKKGEIDKGIDLQRQGLAMQRKFLDEDHMFVGEWRCSLGDSLGKAGKAEEAEGELLEALRIFQKNCGDPALRTNDCRGRTIDCLDRLIKLSQSLGKEEQVEQYKKRRAEFIAPRNP